MIMSVSGVSEKTHTFVPLTSLVDDFPLGEIPADIKLLKDMNSGEHFLYALSDDSQSMTYFEVLKLLKRCNIEPKKKFCSREELKKLTESINMVGDNDNQSELQELALAIIQSALDKRGSDVHIEVTDSYMKVNYRIDSSCIAIQGYETTSKKGGRLINTIYNSMCEQREPANLVFSEPCYARFKDEFASLLGLNSIRVTTRPASDSTIKMVMRLVPRKKKEISDLASTGLTEPEQKILRRVIAKPAGSIITSGPMGHGKSTLSQLLAEQIHIRHPGKHLVSVEDPVESPIPGWYQTPLQGNWDVTLANLVRMDCNGLYLGEIRDIASANGVVSASQTGNIVLTTIHTDQPIDIIQRMRKLGVEEDLLTDATIITCLIGLRLTPLLCNSCKIKYKGNEKILGVDDHEIIEKYVLNSENVYLRNHKGCNKCGHTGFHGRTGVFEIIETDYKFMRLYASKGKFEAWNYWRQNGGITLCDNVKRLIDEGKIDPIKAHQEICSLDRDEKFYEQD